MKTSFALVAIAGLVAAQDSFNPTSATVSLLEAMPASLQAIAATNTLAVASILESDFLAGSAPSWFTGLPTAVQSYFIAQGEAALGVTPSGSAASTAAAGGTSTTAKTTTTAAGSSSAAAKTSSGMAAPTAAMLGSGFAGVIGMIGVLAL